jgi:AraC family transcriptional regulator
MKEQRSAGVISPPRDTWHDEMPTRSLPLQLNSAPLSVAPDPTRLGHLVRGALAVFTSDREAAWRCLIDASALLESDAAPALSQTTKIAVRPGSLAVWQAKRALAYIEANLESKIAIRDMAELFVVSKSHFSRAFKSSVGSPPMTYVSRRRVEKAKQLMTSRTWRLTDIALACGFADQSHLTRVFRRVVGMSPGVWRRCAEVPNAGSS